MGAGQQFGHVYGYRLDPIAGGTLVTHYYDWSEITDDIRAFADLPRHLRDRVAGDIGNLGPNRCAWSQASSRLTGHMVRRPRGR